MGGSNQAPVILPPPPPPELIVAIPNSGNPDNTDKIIFYSDFNCTGGQQKIFYEINLTPSNTLQLIGFLPKSFEVGYNLNFYYKLEYPRQNIANSQDINKISPEKSVKYNIDPILFNGIINFTIRAIILPTKVGSVEKNDYISMTFPDGTTKLIYEQPTVFNNGITEVFVKGTITKGNFPTKMSFRSIGFLMITSDEVPKLENGAVGGAMTVNPMYNAYTKTFSNLPGISKDIIETSEFYNIWNSHNWKYWILPIIKLPQPVPQQAPLIVQSNGNIGIPKSVQNFEGFSDIGDNAFFYLIIIAIILIVYFNYNRIRKLF